MRLCLEAGLSLARPFQAPKTLRKGVALRKYERWTCPRCLQKSRRSLQPSDMVALAQNTRDRSIRNHLRAVNHGKRAWDHRKSFSTSRQRGQSNQNEELPSKADGRRSHLSRRLSHLMDHMQSNIFIAGQRLNDLTGYSGIEALKRDIETQEQIVRDTRASMQAARSAYSAAISTRASSQREVNELLQRKHAWSPDDLERFTALYRSDHANEQAEASAREKLDRIEDKSEEEAAKLTASILARYHEEQIWSDKIRQMSTWGTWGLIGVNVLLFLVFQVGVEPWRRKRLVKGFEEKVQQALEKEAANSTLPSMQEDEPALIGGMRDEDTQDPDTTLTVGTSHEQRVAEADPVLEPSQSPATSSVGAPEYAARQQSSTMGSIRASLKDLFSERQVTIRRVDLTAATLEGAAAGVAFVGMLVLLVLRPR